MAFTVDEIAQAYGELRAIARQLHASAPPSLAGTAGVNEVLAAVLAEGGERSWNDRAHFVRHCVLRLRSTWLNHRRLHQRRFGVLVLHGLAGDAPPAPGVHRGEAPPAPLASSEPGRSDPATTLALLEAIEDACARGGFADPRRAVAGLVAKHVLGMTDDEAAAVAGTSEGTFKRDQRELAAWLRGALAGERAELQARLDAFRRDERVKRRAEIAAVAEALLVQGRSADEVAAATGSTPRKVRVDLEFFLTWQPAPERA